MARHHARAPHAAYDSVRAAAMQTLIRVERDAAYANVLLGEAVRGMSARDAAFCTALTLGVLRRRAQLDWALDRELREPVAKAQAATRQILRLGAFQILHMHVRKAAAVDESVKLAKVHVSPGAAKLVNAVLRKIDGPRVFGRLFALDLRLTESWSAVSGLPVWYVQAAREAFDDETAMAVCIAACNEPPLTVRTNTARTDTVRLRTLLAEARIGARTHPLVPDLLTVYCPAPVLAASAPFRDGLCHVQDGSAVLAALALEVQHGDRVADLCAAPGGKTAILASQAGPSGEVLAFEKDADRAVLIEELVSREQLANVRIETGDAAQHPDLAPGTFDRVLVDAPCSGVGIARHRPDMLWHGQPNIDRSLAAAQRALLNAGVRCLKPGGVLIYSVCSFLRTEGRAVAQDILRQNPAVRADPLPHLLARWTDSPEHAIIPPGNGALDGFTIIRFRRAE